MTAVNDNRTLADCEPFSRLPGWILWRLEPPRREGAKPVKIPLHHDASANHSLKHPAMPMDATTAAQWLAWCRASGRGHDRPGEVGYMGLGFRPEGTGLVCLDIDDCLTPANEWSDHAKQMLARFPGALVELSTSGRGLHIWFTHTGEGPGKRPRDRTGMLEMYAEGQFLALGTVLAGDARTDCTAEMHRVLAQYWPAVAAPREVTDSEWDSLPQDKRLAVTWEMLDAFKHIPQSDYHSWMRMGCALKSLGDEGFDLWHAFSKLHPDYDEWEVTTKWEQLAADRTDYRAIFAEAQRNGWQNPRSWEARVDRAISAFEPPVIQGTTVQASLPPPAPPAAAAQESGVFKAGDGGFVAPSISSVSQALRSHVISLRVGRDTFRGAQMIGQNDQWRDWEDEDYTVLRETLENAGFKPVPAEIVKSSVASVARENQFDSALQWAATLAWDGVPRVTTAMAAYYGCEDTAYTRAVGEYLFSALADRLLNPGCQADMVVVLVGDQGLAKTSAVAALAPTPSAFVEVSLSHRDETDLSRKLRGKLVAEIAEMRGLGTKEIEGIRAWVTRRTEAWVPKYREAETTYARRFLALGTVNGEEFLDDAEGERRWLPVRVGQMDLKGLERDRDQLWAEGIHMLRNGGQRWQMAQELARIETSQFKVVDPWTPDVVDWLAGKASPHGFLGRHVPGTDFTTRDVLGALNIAVERRGRGESNRVSKILKGLGYRLAVAWEDGSPVKRWRK